MKIRYIIIPALILGLMSCSREDEFLKESNKVDINISARIVGTPDDASVTRTYMGSLDNSGTVGIYPVLWSEGDVIGLITGGKTAQVELTGGADTNIGTFGGKADDIVAPFPGTDYYPAAYPAKNAFAQVSSDKMLVGSYLPYIQKYKSGTFADNVYAMAAVSQSQGAVYDFYNLCGVIQLKIRANGDGDVKNQIRALYLTGNNHEVLAGGVGMNFNVSDGSPVVSTAAKDGPEAPANMKYEVETYGSEGYERVIIDFGESPLQLKPDETTYINIAVIPQTFTNGFTVEMVDAGNLGSTYKSIDTEITIQRSCVKSMQEFIYAQGDPLEIANSYIYSDAGYYLMPGYCMGNRLDVKLDPDNHHKKAAALLWSELVKDGVSGRTSDTSALLPAVTNIEYVPFSDGNGMLQFKINIDPRTGEPYRGNAAIALYDPDTKEILWSWHIWMCEAVHDVIIPGLCDGGEYDCEYPDGSVYHYKAEAAEGNMVIMDRNLGAISADRHDGWKTYGLYYQNGRRDPFIGGHYNGTNVMPSTLTAVTPVGDESYMSSVRYDEETPFGEVTPRYWFNAELAPNGWRLLQSYVTVSRALQAPMDFACGAYDGSVVQAETKGGGGATGTAQWTKYTESDNLSWLDPSVNSAATHGTTGLRNAGHEAYWNRTKTVMDPCPVGYSVLGAGNDKSYFFGNTATKTYYASDSDGYGVEVTHLASNGVTYHIWWPAGGVRTYTGRMANVGYSGAYFYYDHIEESHGGHGMYFVLSTKENKGVITLGEMKSTQDVLTNHATPLRCVREKQDISTYPLK